MATQCNDWVEGWHNLKDDHGKTIEMMLGRRGTGMLKYHSTQCDLTNSFCIFNKGDLNKGRRIEVLVTAKARMILVAMEQDHFLSHSS